MIHGLQFLFLLGTNLLETDNIYSGAARPLIKTWSVVIFITTCHCLLKRIHERLDILNFESLGYSKVLAMYYLY